MRILELHAPYFRTPWRRAHDVLCWGPYPHCDLRAPEVVMSLDEVLLALPSGWQPDLIVLGDDSRSLLVLGLEDAPCPTVMLSVDTHHHAWWHAPLGAAHDAVFVGQRDYLGAFAAAGAADARWLPLWAPDATPPPEPVRTHAVGFVGTLDPKLHPDRVDFLEAVGRHVPIHAVGGPWAPVYCRSRVVLNQTIKSDLNFRVFEALAAGALLLTEHTGNGLLDLFEDAEHLVTYPRGDVEAAVDRLRQYLADDAARARIAAAGHALVRARHLESHRAAHVLAVVQGGLARRPAEVRIPAAGRAYAQLAFRARRAIEVLGDTPFYRGLRIRYLQAALALTLDPRMGESHASAIRGMVAAEQGRIGDAVALLGQAAELGAPVEDHLLRIELLVRAGDLRGARAAADGLQLHHPDYQLGSAFAAALGEAAADGAPA